MNGTVNVTKASEERIHVLESKGNLQLHEPTEISKRLLGEPGRKTGKLVPMSAIYPLPLDL